MPSRAMSARPDIASAANTTMPAVANATHTRSPRRREVSAEKISGPVNSTATATLIGMCSSEA